eukprot:ANDGO_08028.mRNA.1 SWI/SNF complex subunit SWI3
MVSSSHSCKLTDAHFDSTAWEKICAALAADSSVDTSGLTNRQLMNTFQGLWNLADEHLGLNSKEAIKPKIPSFVLRDYRLIDGTVYHMLKFILNQKVVQQIRRFEWQNATKHQQYLDIYHEMRDMLRSSGHFRSISVYFEYVNVTPAEQDVVKFFAARIAEKREDAHLIVADDLSDMPKSDSNSADREEEDEEFVRTISKSEKTRTVHWWYHPDSYNSVVANGELELDDDLVEADSIVAVDDPSNMVPRRVTRRFLADSMKFREWMNPLDYETELPVPSTDVLPAELVSKYAEIEEAERPVKRMKVSSDLRNESVSRIDEAEDEHMEDVAARLQNTEPVMTVSVPSYADWFSLENVHECEKQALPMFFDRSSATRTPEIYVQYRNEMVRLFRCRPDRYLSLSFVRRFLRGDVVMLSRIFAFLEKWGIINHAVDIPKVPVTVSDRSYVSKVVSDHPDGLLPKTSLSFSGLPPVLADSHKLAPADVFPNMMSQAAAFAGVNVEDPDWTPQETLSLLQAIEKYGDAWSQVAAEVGTKTKEQCVAHFLRLPIEDSYLAQYDRNASSLRDDLAFLGSANPIMVMLAFLRDNVDEKVAAEAAKELSAALSDPSKKAATESVRHNVGIMVSASMRKALELAVHEEREIAKCAMRLVELQMRKVHALSKTFQNLDKHVHNDYDRLDRARQQLMRDRFLLSRDKMQLLPVQSSIMTDTPPAAQVFSQKVPQPGGPVV